MAGENIQYKPKGDGVLEGEVTAAQVKAWKDDSKYGIYGAKVKGKIIYFRFPDLNDLNCAYAKADPDHMLNKWKELADVTFLGGCEEILNNDRMFASIVDKLQSAAAGEESELVNL